MRDRNLTVPELMFVVATRAALAAGVALLIAGRLNDKQRRMIGATLVAIGAVFVGYWIGRAYWGRGYATAATMAVRRSGTEPRGHRTAHHQGGARNRRCLFVETAGLFVLPPTTSG